LFALVIDFIEPKKVTPANFLILKFALFLEEMGKSIAPYLIPQNPVIAKNDRCFRDRWLFVFKIFSVYYANNSGPEICL